MDPFAVLGLEETADDEAVRAAYVQALRASRLTVIPKAFAASGRLMRRSAIPKAAWLGCLVRHPWPTLRSFLTPFLRSAAMLALAPGSMCYGSRDDERA